MRVEKKGAPRVCQSKHTGGGGRVGIACLQSSSEENYKDVINPGLRLPQL